MYKSDWFHKIASRGSSLDRSRNILDIALDVKMTKEGSYTRNSEDQQEDIEALRFILETWDRTYFPRNAEWDGACKKIVELAIEYGERSE